MPMIPVEDRDRLDDRQLVRREPAPLSFFQSADSSDDALSFGRVALDSFRFNLERNGRHE